MRSLYPLIFAHFRSQWRLLVIGGVGFLIAGVLLASAPLYLSTTREGNLRFEMQQRLLEDLDIHFVVLFRPMESDTYGQMDRFVRDKIKENTNWFVRSVIQYGNTEEFFLILPDAELQIEPNTPRVTIQFLQEVETHTRLVDGAWWSLKKPGQNNGPMEVVLGAQAAATLGLKVGDQINIIASAQDLSRKSTMTVVGLAEPIEPRSEYWLGYDRFSLQTSGSMSPPSVPLFISPEMFLSQLGRELFPASANYWWFMYIRPELLDSQNIKAVTENVNQLQNEVSSTYPRASAFTALEQVVSRHHARDLLIFGPHRLLLIFSIGVVFVYLLVTGGILAERQRNVLGLLRSRGVPPTRLVMPLIIEATVMALLAIVATPPLVMLVLSSQLSIPLEALTGADLTRNFPSTMSYLFLAGGLTLGTLVFLLPTFNMCRGSDVVLRHSIRGRQTASLVLRWYFDIFLLFVGAILAWEFSRSDGVVTRSILGSPAENPLFVVAPFCLLTGGALLFVRMLPFVFRVAATLLNAMIPAWISLGLWMLGRHPSNLASLGLLLTIASGTIVAAASVEPTLVNSIGDVSPNMSKSALGGVLPDPVLVISLEALTRMVILSVILLASIGSLFAAQGVIEQRFVQLGVLQAMGMSKQEVTRWLVLEHILILICALGAGVFIGYQISEWAFPLLDLGVANPFILEINRIETNWFAVLSFMVVVSTILLGALSLSLRVIRRSSLQAGMRLGEEV